MKNIIWKIELLCTVLLAISAVVWGLRPGVWNGTTFYRMTAQQQERTYSHPGHSTVEVAEEAGEGQLRILSQSEQTADFLFAATENGSQKSLRITSRDGSGVWNATYNAAAKAFMGESGNNYSISDLVQVKEHFSPDLSDAAIYNMALGNETSRIGGRLGEFLLAGLFLVLGLGFRFLLEPMIGLDKFLVGLFYKDADNLQATELTRVILSLLGIVIFAIGTVWWCSILFA